MKHGTEILSELRKKSVPVQTDVDLSVYSSFKIGGAVPIFIEPENLDQIFDAIFIFQKFSVPYKLLGGGTNLLISDHPDNFAVVKLGGEFKNFSYLSDGRFSVGAASLTTPTFRKISNNGYTGAEFLSTIPGSVGGAVIQNAGCYGGEFFSLIESVEFLRNGKIELLQKDSIRFGYRTSEFLEEKNSIILRILIQLQEGKIQEIEKSLETSRKKRNQSQPKNKKSAGSVFKNPSGDCHLKSWELIDRAGLRGVSKGDALISPEHCNFITNEGHASAKDVDYLIRMIQETVFKQFGVLLEKEIEYFGDIL